MCTERCVVHPPGRPRVVQRPLGSGWPPVEGSVASALGRQTEELHGARQPAWLTIPSLLPPWLPQQPGLNQNAVTPRRRRRDTPASGVEMSAASSCSPTGHRHPPGMATSLMGCVHREKPLPLNVLIFIKAFPEGPAFG